ncbi:unnamed protein product [Soboliphyme baturini]|uniref:HA2 domain-containing protein n=1 Tax=Soboliphyme baturini TaxID=241478 RepID=A0A183IIZ8_9BILA|nr:unnamed protein product [Soboliphyme baturini]
MRDDMVDQFIAFIANPFQRKCPQRCCVDTVIQRLYPDYSARCGQKDVISPRRVIYPLRGNLLNVMIFGSEQLAKQVLDEFQLYVNDDMFEFHRTAFHVKFTVQSDSDLHDELHRWTEYRPNGILCVFSSRETLVAVQNMLFHSGLDIVNGTNDSEDDLLHSRGSGTSPLFFSGMPIVLLLVCDPTQLDDLPYLQQQGAMLATHLNILFIGLESSGNASCFTQDRRARFGGLLIEEQICQTISALISLSVEYRSSSSSPALLQPSGSRPLSDALSPLRREPDCAVLVCLMCGDDYSVELVLSPLLNMQTESMSASLVTTSVGNDLLSSVAVASQDLSSSIDHGDHRHVIRRTFRIDVFLPTAGRKLLCDLTVVAYHTAFHLCSEDVLFDACIMFYSSKRRASFAHLNTFAHLFSQPVPMLMVAVGEVVDFFSDPETKTLVTEGNRLADRIRARFTNVSRSMEQPSGIYTSFLEDVWKAKDRSYKNSIYFTDARSEGDRSPVSGGDREEYLMPASSEHFIPSSYPASDQDKNDEECHYMTLSSFWSGASMPVLSGSVNCPSWESHVVHHQRFLPGQSQRSYQSSRMFLPDVIFSQVRAFEFLFFLYLEIVIKKNKEDDGSCVLVKNEVKRMRINEKKTVQKEMKNKGEDGKQQCANLITDMFLTNICDSGAVKEPSGLRQLCLGVRDNSYDQHVVESTSSMSAGRSSDSSPKKPSSTERDAHVSVSYRPLSPPSCFMCHSSRNVSSTDDSGDKKSRSVPAPLATPENVEINSDSLVSKSTLQNLGSFEQLTADRRTCFDPAAGPFSDHDVMEKTASWLCKTPGAIVGEPLDEFGVSQLPSLQQKRHKRGKMGPCVAERVRKLDAELDLSVMEPSTSMAATATTDFDHPVIRKQRGSFGTVAMPFRMPPHGKSSLSSKAQFRSNSDECLSSSLSSLDGDLVCANYATGRRHGASNLASEARHSSALKDGDGGSYGGNGGFVRRVASSFRLCRKKAVIVESKSVPHSPVTGVRADRVFVLPPFEGIVDDDHLTSKRLGGESDVANALAQIATLAIGSKASDISDRFFILTWPFSDSDRRSDFI